MSHWYEYDTCGRGQVFGYKNISGFCYLYEIVNSYSIRWSYYSNMCIYSNIREATLIYMSSKCTSLHVQQFSKVRVMCIVSDTTKFASIVFVWILLLGYWQMTASSVPYNVFVKAPFKQSFKHWQMSYHTALNMYWLTESHMAVPYGIQRIAFGHAPSS